MRRGLEYMSRTHPPVGDGPVELPSINEDRFVEGFDELDLKSLAIENEIRPIA